MAKFSLDALGSRLCQRHWYRSSLTWLTCLLVPFSWLFRAISSSRYFFYQIYSQKTIYFPVPVIVVGNITVGGTGKTPFVIWLADFLRKEGYRPGIVSRGAGGREQMSPRFVDPHSDTHLLGDEAVLLARRTRCPVVTSINRVAAVRALLEKSDCNVVITDDGLQHYRLGRKLEIAIVDGMRQFGNEYVLPAGPLREPIKRLQTVNFIVVNGQTTNPLHATLKNTYNMQLSGTVFTSLKNADKTIPITAFQNQTVHALAGIGNPDRFFAMLRDHNINVIPHYFPDHYSYASSEIYFEDDLPILMTEKDAVKCANFSGDNHWYLAVDAVLDEQLGHEIAAQLS